MCCLCILQATDKCSCAAGQSCDHPGKHPRTPNGVKDATTDRTIIKAWWNRWPDANIGIATGRPSGIFVLDVDGNVGKASLKELQAEHGRLPKTVTVRTGKGRHRYFRCDGARVGNSVGQPWQRNRCPRRRRLRGRRREYPRFGSRLSFCRWARIGRDRDSRRPRMAARPGSPKVSRQPTRRKRSKSIPFPTPSLIAPVLTQSRRDGGSWIGSQRRQASAERHLE